MITATRRSRTREADRGDEADKPNHYDHLLAAMGACRESDLEPDEKYQKIKELHDLFNPKPKEEEDDEAGEPAIWEKGKEEEAIDADQDEDTTQPADRTPSGRSVNPPSTNASENSKTRNGNYPLPAIKPHPAASGIADDCIDMEEFTCGGRALPIRSSPRVPGHRANRSVARESVRGPAWC